MNLIKITREVYLLIISAVFFFSANALAAPVDNAVKDLRSEWAVIKFQTPRKQQLARFEVLIKKAENYEKKFPNNPRIMTWHGTILSTYSAIKGGLGALPHIKKAKKLLETAISMNSRVEGGLAHGVLGTIYAHVPGWPIAFGNKKTARQHLETTIQMSPRGLDSNYYYGDFLINIGDYQAAKHHLDLASRAAIRKGYEVQDRGRKGEVSRSLAKLNRYYR